MFAKKIGLDIGTTKTVVSLPFRGIVFNEPSVIALSKDNLRPLAFGEKAKAMLGRANEDIRPVKPLEHSAISDYRTTQVMVRFTLEKVLGKMNLFKPIVLASVPAGATSSERRAVFKVLYSTGAKKVYLIQTPTLAAIGVGVPINESSGNMIIDLGGGTTEVAIISLGGIVAFNSVRLGGEDLDRAIMDYLKKKHGILVGLKTAEEIKITLGSAVPQEEEEILEIRASGVREGLPQNISVSTNEINAAIAPILYEIIQGLKTVLKKVPPELSADVIDKGVILTGGGAVLKGIDKLITQILRIPCYVADEPRLSVAKGIAKVLENLERYKKIS